MIEDKLTKAQRIRLESLNMAIHIDILARPTTLPAVLYLAEKIEEWIMKAIPVEERIQ